MKPPALIAAGAAAALALCASAQVAIPAADSVGPVPGPPGDGLNAAVWAATAHSIAEANAVVTGGIPIGLFHSTQVDYPNGLATIVGVGQPLSDFLGVDSGSVFGFDPATVDSASKVFVFSGAIAIPVPGMYNFGVQSDDGMRLRIGSQILTEFDGDRGFGLSSESAVFVEPGLYPIELLYWANEVGESGVELLWNAGGIDPLFRVPPGSLYTIPSPGSVALLGAGGMMLVRRRR